MGETFTGTPEYDPEETFYLGYAALISEVLQDDQVRVLPESTFADLDADSLDIVELVMAAEEKYDIEIPEAELEGIETAGQFLELVKKKLQVKDES